MSRLAVRIALAGVLLLAAATAHGAPCLPTPQGFDYASYDPEIRLDLDAMISLPPETVILAGAFHDSGNTVHPALLTSGDGGTTWSTVPLPIPGAGLGVLQADGTESLWGVVGLRQEGLDAPLSVLRSRDTGRTWCLLPLDGLEIRHGVDQFRMFDHRHGLLVFSAAPFGGGYTAYETSDGGDSWQRLWRADGPPPDAVEAGADYPERIIPPPHATLWRREADFFAADAIIRIRDTESAYVVERQDALGDGNWRTLSRISKRYQVVDGDLTALP